jgi:hypothetical protein
VAYTKKVEAELAAEGQRPARIHTEVTRSTSRTELEPPRQRFQCISEGVNHEDGRGSPGPTRSRHIRPSCRAVLLRLSETRVRVASQLQVDHDAATSPPADGDVLTAAAPHTRLLGKPRSGKLSEGYAPSDGVVFHHAEDSSSSRL